MINSLIGVHAILGELGIASFLWVFIEMLNPTEKRLHRAKIAAFLGVILFFASWIIGGYYYLTDYGSIIKPIIKGGTQPWIHGVFMEAKEHIFLFLPFISILVYSLISGFQSSLGKNKNILVQKSILILSLLILLIGFLMGLLGYIISSGYRSALEAIV